MQLQDRRIKLPYGEALPHLKQCMVEYYAHWYRLALGVTSHPDLCLTRHAGQGWERMYLLYLAPRHEPAWALQHELMAAVHRFNSQTGTVTLLPREEPSHRESEGYVYLLLAGGSGTVD